MSDAFAAVHTAVAGLFILAGLVLAVCALRWSRAHERGLSQRAQYGPVLRLSELADPSDTTAPRRGRQEG